MKYTSALILLAVANIDVSVLAVELNDMNEAEFEQHFNLPTVEDPEEYKRREEALKKNEDEIKKINEAYRKGEKTWFDGLNEFADLPADEFIKEKTGMISNTTFGRGLLEPPPEARFDAESERYFDQFRFNRVDVPASYNAKELGLVSPARNQKQCGSCAAFATIGAVEVCFKKITNVFGDYSEQQLVDCAYGQDGFYACNGAWPHAYAKWIADNQIGLTHESHYPYLNQDPSLSCPADLPVYNQGAQLSGYYYTYEGDEELLKKMVYEHGAVVTAVRAQGPFQNYEGGIFAGCDNSNQDHAVTVVGYGTDNGDDYWLIKNSWGEDWGEQGFIRMKRGVNMCGIGTIIVVVHCTETTGPTDGPLTTKKPCNDKYSNCGDLINYCSHPNIREGCPESCGLCPEMTPVQICSDMYANCNDMTAYCHFNTIAAGCKKACNLC